MPVSQIVIVRHATRADSVDPLWSKTSPSPYDPPLADPKGFDESLQTAASLSKQLAGQTVVIHSSPFLRCVQTAVSIANALDDPEVSIRLDSVFGEWQSTDYFTDISPPPPDGHRSIAENAWTWYYLNCMKSINERRRSILDTTWPLHKLGFGGDYGESWSAMHNRFDHGLKELVSHYDSVCSSPVTVVIVTHGAGCNSLLGLISNLPLLTKIGLASYAIAKRVTSPLQDNDFKWTIIFNSNKSPPDETARNIPQLSSSNSTSFSSISDIGEDDYTPNITRSPEDTPSEDMPTYPDHHLNWFTPSINAVPTLNSLVFDLGAARPATPLHEHTTSEEPILLSFGDGFDNTSIHTAKSSPSMTPSRS
ncbi:hypothetical protein AWJ20_3513 [Sugiyamaella lignohabitans]|uniref:Uncharacterized protein n=1 Tax=Sugiyamaella lignohabitans TaxID=796027 RepID=A0A167FYK7_9ASCO|nr:uncharacterized protein AWJ20_3513 [Sugiyamaella lignohabitans]ANB15869.1 hypothetical protein AWJ20_3513 [Sugiyamaella lignohabitans]